MQYELAIDDLDMPIDPAGTLELSRVSGSVIKSIIKVVGDVVVATLTH